MNTSEHAESASDHATLFDALMGLFERSARQVHDQVSPASTFTSRNRDAIEEAQAQRRWGAIYRHLGGLPPIK